MHTVIQDQTASVLKLARQAGYSRTIVHCDPLDDTARTALTEARDAGLRVVLRARQWARAQAPELLAKRPGWVEVPPEWLPRNHKGEAPPMPVEVNSMPSLWNREPWDLVVLGLEEAKAFCAENDISVDGAYLGCSGELGLPRQYGEDIRSDSCIWAHDDATIAAHQHFFGSAPPETLTQDANQTGGRCMDWLYRRLTWLLDWMASRLNLRPWLPVIAPDWEEAGAQSATKLLIEYMLKLSAWGSRAIWLFCASYGVPNNRQPARRVIGSLLRIRLYGLTALTGSEYVHGAVAGYAERAHRDGFAGLLTNTKDLTPDNVDEVREKLAIWESA